MRMMLSATRWIFLLTLAVVTLLSVSEAEAYNPYMGLRCCHRVSLRKVAVRECYEQKPRRGCKHHAFLILSRQGGEWCIDPNAQWLNDKIRKGELDCPPVLSLTSQLTTENVTNRSQ